MDSVLNNLLDVWLGMYNTDYNDTVKVTDITQWDLTKFVKCGKGIYEYLSLPILYEQCTPTPYAAEVITSLQKKHEIYVVTAAINFKAIPYKFDWLQTHYPMIKKKQYITMYEKKMFSGDVLIDDGIHNLLAFHQFDPLRNRCIVYDQPWNRGNKQFQRAKNWNDVERLVT